MGPRPEGFCLRQAQLGKVTGGIPGELSSDGIRLHHLCGLLTVPGVCGQAQAQSALGTTPAPARSAQAPFQGTNGEEFHGPALAQKESKSQIRPRDNPKPKQAKCPSIGNG